jgi:hypothetical protein
MVLNRNADTAWTPDPALGAICQDPYLPKWLLETGFDIHTLLDYYIRLIDSSGAELASE